MRYLVKGIRPVDWAMSFDLGHMVLLVLLLEKQKSEDALLWYDYFFRIYLLFFDIFLDESKLILKFV